MEMRSIRPWIALFSLGPIIGCGAESGTQVVAVKPSPVGGAMVRLPHDAGLVAIKTETADPSRAAKKKPRAAKIVAVFFENDGSTPMTPPPTEVVFELEGIRSNSAGLKTVALEADPRTPNRFVSAASSFPGGLEGKIRVKIDGQDLEESFSAR
ncbi:MAG: hypothetical protein ACLQGP_37110 [Isosphaeraceae bacterium]